MIALLLVPAALQAAAMAADEGYFHRRRGLPRWERRGHPIDTLSVAIAYAYLALASPTTTHAEIFALIAFASCVIVTKDEPIHARLCTAGEHWLHAILFVLHPIVFACFAALWWQHVTTPIALQLALTIAFGLYQITYWRDRQS
ncbi:MAG TPA: hypothetical protein VL463_30955 [Kofleriaceae bacterium]|jgi:hypothetical protein|nr:hypothetical protein [Kofleriaceae bacterium]